MPVNMEDLLYASYCRGPIVCQSCVVRNRERNEDLDEFQQCFHTSTDFCTGCLFTTIATYSRQSWIVFGANIG